MYFYLFCVVRKSHEKKFFVDTVMNVCHMQSFWKIGKLKLHKMEKSFHRWKNNAVRLYILVHSLRGARFYIRMANKNAAKIL